MNKQSILASSLAIALGVTGVSTAVGGHDAHAAEQTQFKYTVQSGDTLNKIGQKFDVTVDQLKQWNDLKSDIIIVGQKLIIHGSNVQSSQNTQYQSQNYTQQHVPQQTQTYTQSNQTQQAHQQGSQQTQHAEQVRTQKAPTSTQTQTPKKAETSNQVQQTQQTQQTQQSSQVKQSGGSVRLSNGNTAGATGSSAAQEMAKRTGVSASTWEHIIARESNGDPNARNASGASGLFQTMPFHGSTATVQDQINAATKAYKAQGLSAWGM